MLYLTESDVQNLLPMREAIRLMQTVFERLASGEALNHPRRRLGLPTGSVLHYMAGSDGKYFGAKIYATNPHRGAHFLFLLYRAGDGQPLAILEANYLGQIRTGAVSGLATNWMARTDAETIGIIGSGFQARSQLEAVLAVRTIRTVKVWSRSLEKRMVFAKDCSSALSLAVQAVETAEQAVREAGIVITATNAKDPVIESEWIGTGTHINAMGSNQAKRRELPTSLVKNADWVVLDSIEQARMESGDLLLALDEADWHSERLVELQEIVSGRVQIRERAAEITIFKSNGLAVEDVISAGFVYEKAQETGRGKSLYS